MKILFFILFIFLIPTVCFPDEIRIPFSCWPLQLQKEFKKEGRKLDLGPNERTKDSWGYIESEGSSYKIFTYNSATDEDFGIIKIIVFKVEKENGNVKNGG